MKTKHRRAKKRSGLTCPSCHGELRVAITRPADSFIYRRRECQSCRLRVTTTERIVGTATPTSIPVPFVVSSVHDLLATLGISVSLLSDQSKLQIGEKK